MTFGCSDVKIDRNMKIFFTGSLRGKKEFGLYYKQIYDLIESFGYKNLDDEILKLVETDFYQQINEKGQDAYIQLFNRKIQKLKEADIVIFECSTHSLSIGYMIEKALNINKPTIILYLEGHTPQFIIGDDNEKLVITAYRKDSLGQVLKSAFDKAENLRDKRFNFFVSPEILVYLDEVSRKYSISKSVFIRNLIEEHRKKERKNKK